MQIKRLGALRCIMHMGSTQTKGMRVMKMTIKMPLSTLECCFEFKGKMYLYIANRLFCHWANLFLLNTQGVSLGKIYYQI